MLIQTVFNFGIQIKLLKWKKGKSPRNNFSGTTSEKKTTSLVRCWKKEKKAPPKSASRKPAPAKEKKRKERPRSNFDNYKRRPGVFIPPQSSVKYISREHLHTPTHNSQLLKNSPHARSRMSPPKEKEKNKNYLQLRWIWCGRDLKARRILEAPSSSFFLQYIPLTTMFTH